MFIAILTFDSDRDRNSFLEKVNLTLLTLIRILLSLEIRHSLDSEFPFNNKQKDEIILFLE
jgi:hypothetical protein